MRKSLILMAFIFLLCLCGCEVVNQASVDTEPNEVRDTMPMVITETESTDALAEEPQSSVNIEEPTVDEAGIVISTGENQTGEPVTGVAQKSTKNPQGSESETTPSFELVKKPTVSQPAEEKQIEPSAPSEPPRETEEPRFEPPAPPTYKEPHAATETITPIESEPPVETQPKTAYDYEFDINAIRADCVAIGQSMGYTLNTSLTPQNATWWNPVTASESNQGSTLKSALEQYIRFHTVENLGAYGLDEITEFNICCESRTGGSYAIYFVFA